MNQFYKLIKVDIEKYGGDTIQEWWDRHTPEEQKKMLVEECEKLEARLRELDEALATYRSSMKTEELPTVVVFRKWRDNGDILALFPYEDEGHGRCSSYEHVGQHGGADYQGCITATRPATPEEYADLKLELERIGYVLKIQQRR